MNGSDALLREALEAADALAAAWADGAWSAAVDYSAIEQPYERWLVARAALRAALDATKPADPVETFLDSIPDDGLPGRIGDHYRVVTVCGHCGEVWSKLALDATNEPEPDDWTRINGRFLSTSSDRLRCGQCGDELVLDEIVGHLAAEGRALPPEPLMDATLGYIAALEKVFALARNQPGYNRAALREALADVSGPAAEYLIARPVSASVDREEKP